MKTLFASIVCAFALFLPYRMRMLFCEALGWLFQMAYYLIFRVARFILKSLER